MSRTTDHFITLLEATEEISCLHDALQLELEYDNSKGTSTKIQEYFRELKYNYITEALKKYDLFDKVHHYYNYSMQGLVQLFFDNEPQVLDKIKTNQKSLEEDWKISLANCIEERREAIVVTISIPESNLKNKK